MLSTKDNIGENLREITRRGSVPYSGQYSYCSEIQNMLLTDYMGKKTNT
jgi:hypothetical protein